MPGNTAIEVRVTTATLPAHDPLELYVRLRDALPADDVFLFENINGPGQDRSSAVVGHGRLCEIRVYAGHVEIDGVPALTEALVALAQDAGLSPGLEFTEPDRVWELLSAAQRLFAVESDIPVTEYAFGFLTTLSYESAWHMETLPPRTKAPRCPDITLTLFRDTVWYDPESGSVRHLTARSRHFAASADVACATFARDAAAAGPAFVPEADAPRSVHDTLDRATFLKWAEQCLEHIRVGDIYQIQIGHRIDVETALTPVDVYRRLRHRNPSPHMYLLPRAGLTPDGDGDGAALIGASPELFFRVVGDEIVMRPIAGTARRGADESENERRVKELRESTKEQAEHIMLVDLCRNDVGRVSRPSTQPVDRLMAVESFSHVFHLVSTVAGTLEERVDTWEAVRATFPAGTMTGAPKIRAMEIIDGLEREARGNYAGAVGLVDVRGWSELALCIRTVEYDGRRYTTQSSAGLVAQSLPESEWLETLVKMGAAYWALTGEELLS
ncbi:anthranilate synthase component I family protein [Streptomyces sp. C11-1]|uniref:Anthranilate synthase component I family protein n=1 Tax=Streptomyces durocortorensis TaxID=2811104 RepID=A0ABY9VW57_9ACTN|nr:anthranilate synthase component I family protein [Streptomyces durocortorensis]WNF28023.1 anthranilate synthase component I family protein [Streptomyces durocortorensis]